MVGMDAEYRVVQAPSILGTVPPEGPGGRRFPPPSGNGRGQGKYAARLGLGTVLPALR
jgi:hypothetical protein